MAQHSIKVTEAYLQLMRTLSLFAKRQRHHLGESIVHPQLTLNLDPERTLTFSTFWTGNNALLRDVLERLARAESPDTQIYIQGAKGIGKTHLLCATCQLATEQGYRIAYLPAQMIEKEQDLQGYEQYDLVCIDDLHKLAKTRHSELALFGLINALRQTRGRLLLGSDVALAALNLGVSDLASRLSWGAAFTVQSVPQEQIAVALDMRARHFGLVLESEVIDYLLARQSRDFASLVALLAELNIASLRAKRRVTIPLVRETLATIA